MLRAWLSGFWSVAPPNKEEQELAFALSELADTLEECRFLSLDSLSLDLQGFPGNLKTVAKALGYQEGPGAQQGRSLEELEACIALNPVEAVGVIESQLLSWEVMGRELAETFKVTDHLAHAVLRWMEKERHQEEGERKERRFSLSAQGSEGEERQWLDIHCYLDAQETFRYVLAKERCTAYGAYKSYRKGWELPSGGRPVAVLYCNRLIPGETEELKWWKVLEQHGGIERRVPLWGSYYDRRFCREIFLAENANGGELREWKDAPQAVREKLIFLAMESGLKFLKSLHAQGFIHRDIKLSNLFVFTDPKDENVITDVRVGDYGFLTQQPKKGQFNREIAGTPFYQSQEVRKGKQNTPSDIWALARVLFKLRYGKKGQYPACYDRGEYALAAQKQEEELDGMDLLLREMLAYAPEERPSAGEALERFHTLCISQRSQGS